MVKRIFAALGALAGSALIVLACAAMTRVETLPAGQYPLREAPIVAHQLQALTTGTWNAAKEIIVDVRHVGVLISDVDGTYISLGEPASSHSGRRTYWANSAVILVRTAASQADWEQTIEKARKKYFGPRDVLPTVKE